MTALAAVLGYLLVGFVIVCMIVVTVILLAGASRTVRNALTRDPYPEARQLSRAQALGRRGGR